MLDYLAKISFHFPLAFRISETVSPLFIIDSFFSISSMAFRIIYSKLLQCRFADLQYFVLKTLSKTRMIQFHNRKLQLRLLFRCYLRLYMILRLCSSLAIKRMLLSKPTGHTHRIFHQFSRPNVIQNLQFAARSAQVINYKSSNLLEDLIVLHCTVLCHRFI